MNLSVCLNSYLLKCTNFDYEHNQWKHVVFKLLPTLNNQWILYKSLRIKFKQEPDELKNCYLPVFLLFLACQ